MLNIPIDQIKNFITPEGQEVLVKFIRKAKAERGENWIESLTKEFPLFKNLSGLVCEKTEFEALAAIKKEYPILKLGLFDKQLVSFYRKLKSVFEEKK